VHGCSQLYWLEFWTEAWALLYNGTLFSGFTAQGNYRLQTNCAEWVNGAFCS